MVGNSLFFFGNRHVKVPHNTALDPGTGDFTVDGWVIYAAAGQGQNLTVVKKANPPSPGWWQLIIRDTSPASGKLRFDVWAAPFGVGPEVNITPNTWHHVAATLKRGSPDTITLYVDGIGTSFPVTIGPNVASSADLLIGGDGVLAGEIAVDEVEIFNRTLSPQEIQDIFNARSAGKCKSDLGDAPDSTNHPGAPMQAYASPPTQANFPTVYDPNLLGNAPLGPIHLNAKGLAWLGVDVSFEGEADQGWDQDGVTNIDPANPANIGTPNRDNFDDGVTSVLLPDCAMTNLSFSATNGLTTSTQVYINVWFDWTRDGDWDDMPKCAVAPNIDALAPEWAVQNHVVTLNPGFNAGLVTPPFRSINPPPGKPVWMRITLTDVPISAANHGGPFPNPADLGKGGSGPVGGYPFGETEDYLLRVQSGMAEICVTKFEDKNGNGVQNSGEPGLSGWQIEVTDVSGNPIPGSPFTTTGTGTICFGVPAPATYTISEGLPLGWTQTAPQPVPPGTHTVTVSPGQLVNLSFGNRKWCTVENIFYRRLSDIANQGQEPMSWLTSHPVLRLMRAWQQGLIDLPLFYRVRDEILAQTPAGQRYIDLFYTHDPEILSLLLADPALWDEGEAVLLLWEPNLRALVAGQGKSVIITAGQIQAVQRFLDHLSAAGSAELQQVIAAELTRLGPLENFVGMTMEEARNVVIGWKLYLPLVLKQ